jgi:hypothetical protein
MGAPCKLSVKFWRLATRGGGFRMPSRAAGHKPQEHPLVVPQVSHFMQVPLRTSVKLPHSEQASPS